MAVLVVVGVPAATAGYIVLAERLLRFAPARAQPAVRPWLWLAPALALLFFYLVYPSLNTIYLSLLNATSSEWVGLANYAYIFGNDTMLVALRNNAIWVVVFTAGTVLFGLLVAVLTDRVRYERLANAMIFLPMAVSFVATGVIWKFMYDFAPERGTLNAVFAALIPGYEAQAWLINAPWNNLFIIAAATWVWTGFCLVILSAGLKGISAELLEAGRVDGANEWQVFRHIILPLLAPTIAVVTTTMIIFALKAFDIVYVMTNGNYDTEVIANRMYKEMFNFRDFGRASAIAVVLLAAIVPVMLLNIKRFREQEETR
jgi:alpha-glucoside transport system permease protein